MWLVPVEDVRDGMILGQSVYDDQGVTLLKQGVRLSRRLAELLARRGVLSVYVTDNDGSYEIPEFIRRRVRAEGARALHAAFTAARFGQVFASRSLRRFVATLIDDLLSRPFAIYALVEARTVEFYTFGHSLNVCALAVVIGKSLGIPTNELPTLAMGALLHDIGKARLDSGLLEKREPLTESEREELRRHPIYGFEILQRQPGVSLSEAKVAHQHHERLDGSGYPNGLRGDQITREARIVAVADVYDAMTSDRPYRRRLSPHQALRHILSEAGSKLDRRACLA
ncbi:MAG TPA: HD-GYP domain-containing protein, partial [Bacillota bacterium]